MSEIHQNAMTPVIPTLRYRDGKAAINWLCDAFEFEEQLVVHDKSGAVAHAQLTYGNGMIMLGAANNNEFHTLIKSPIENGGLGSQSVYIVVEDIDHHYRRAITAGAEIVIDIKDEEHGGRAYSCRDPEGHIWNFGSYDPSLV